MAQLKHVTALILGGGLGTRLRSKVSDLPKVLMPVNGRPFLSFLLDKLVQSGFRHAILSTGYKGEQIEEAFGAQYKSLRLEYCLESEPLGTGGALRYALPRIETDLVLAMNGDSYVDVDLRIYLKWYSERNRDAALVLTEVKDASRFGRVTMDEKGRITHFEEKGRGRGPGWINAGIYVLKKSVLESTPSGRAFSLEIDFFPSIVGKALYGYKSSRGFIDIGTPQSYAMAERFFAERQQ